MPAVPCPQLHPVRPDAMQCALRPGALNGWGPGSWGARRKEACSLLLGSQPLRGAEPARAGGVTPLEQKGSQERVGSAEMLGGRQQGTPEGQGCQSPTATPHLLIYSQEGWGVAMASPERARLP